MDSKDINSGKEQAFHDPLFAKLRRFQMRNWTEQLYREYENICFQYRADLKKPSIAIVEGCRYWGRWEPIIRRLSLNRDLIVNYPWDTVVEVLKHEMAHQWVHEALDSPHSGHGPEFHQACDRFAVASWARSATGDIQQAISRNPEKLSPEDAAVLKRVEKLLALGRSDNEHEACLAMKEVQRLNQRYQWERLKNRAETSYDYITICHKLKVVPQHQTLIASILSSFFSVDIVFNSLYDAKDQISYKSLELMGSTKHLQIADYVYHYLWHQLPLLWQAHKANAGRKSNRKSFYIGLLTGFHEQLEEQSKAATSKDLSEAQALITRNRQELDQFVADRHPRVHRRSYQCQLRDNDAFQDGKKQGRLMKLRPGIRQHEGALKRLKPGHT
ncbi:DUF2786 domain-containing protein [Pseudobacteriovorax antillogorgiicola]|uniref:SprT-like family protein n=1 Tax=Pseudobacteriovorax antillogorgiicola TaxID=1513793 RepID=A0A1Y6BNF7_9BACT|nr:DUF2786 domain-containing protein [Pseudobacteriovorax antillogorgiicola]TCS53882.1 uncharacterized protein DUF2786 [Pseudobacteriovorax antillogorgiicola]SMF21068.1 Protein of unknown function [Pseudobacteriovorax antillogorgiicola]